jgi:hypothetical protein
MYSCKLNGSEHRLSTPCRSCGFTDGYADIETQIQRRGENASRNTRSVVAVLPKIAEALKPAGFD